ncbi:hypothetical protein LX36DRAFT_358513 [Colletotrichum falcatum]|nr:hypothetical protein LX36DRAFT_358513 [Colletotrichum falcatum]
MELGEDKRGVVPVIRTRRGRTLPPGGWPIWPRARACSLIRCPCPIGSVILTRSCEGATTMFGFHHTILERSFPRTLSPFLCSILDPDCFSFHLGISLCWLSRRFEVCGGSVVVGRSLHKLSGRADNQMPPQNLTPTVGFGVSQHVDNRKTQTGDSIHSPQSLLASLVSYPHRPMVITCVSTQQNNVSMTENV